MDWNVQVILHGGQMKTVQVFDYNNAEDAKAAAVAQTGAKRAYSATCFLRVNHPDLYPDTTTEESQSYQEEYRPSYNPISHFGRGSNSGDGDEILVILFFLCLFTINISGVLSFIFLVLFLWRFISTSINHSH